MIKSEIHTNLKSGSFTILRIGDVMVKILIK